MTDILSDQQRSERMKRVRQSGTAPELAVRHALHAMGLRYRVNASDLPGRPDLVFPKYNAAVFVHGCFWHQHRCAAGRLPATNTRYWLPKLEANRSRDRRKSRALRELGWRVFTVWACQVKSAKRLEATARALAQKIRDTQSSR